MFPIYNQILDDSFIVCRKGNNDTLHFLNDIFFVFDFPLNFGLTFIEPKMQDMS